MRRTPLGAAQLMLVSGTLAACGSGLEGPCRSLRQGQDASSLPKLSEQVVHAPGSVSTSPAGCSATRPEPLTEGSALRDYCCWRRAQPVVTETQACMQVACSGAAAPEVSRLGAPYSFDYPTDGCLTSVHRYACFVAQRAGKVSSAWSADYRE